MQVDLLETLDRAFLADTGEMSPCVVHDQDIGDRPRFVNAIFGLASIDMPSSIGRSCTDRSLFRTLGLSSACGTRLAESAKRI